MRENRYSQYTGKLKLSNNFHNSTATVQVKDGIISTTSLKRAEKKLCGLKGCCCGGVRGPQKMDIEIYHDSEGRYAKVSELWRIIDDH